MTQLAKKTYWQKPEGKTGLALLIGVGIAGLLLWSQIVTWVVALLANTLLAMGLLAVITLLVVLAMDPNMRAAVEFLFKRGTYNLTNAIYKIDPIGVLRVAVINMWKKVKEMMGLKDQLSQQIKLTIRTMRQNEADSQKAAQAAESSDKYNRFVEQRQAERLAASNVDYQDVLKQLQGIDACLDIYIKVTTALARDSENEANNQEKDRTMLLKSHRILKQAAKTLKDHEEAMDLFNQGLEILVTERTNLLAEVDNFAQLITDAVGKIDVNAGIVGPDGKTVNEWEQNAHILEKRVDLLLLGPGQPNPLTNAIDATPRRESVAARKRGSTPGSTTYNDLFGGDDADKK